MLKNEGLRIAFYALHQEITVMQANLIQNIKRTYRKIFYSNRTSIFLLSVMEIEFHKLQVFTGLNSWCENV